MLLRFRYAATARVLVLALTSFGFMLSACGGNAGGFVTPPPPFTPAPTSAPTSTPTSAPTATPTSAPTATPPSALSITSGAPPNGVVGQAFGTNHLLCCPLSHWLGFALSATGGNGSYSWRWAAAPGYSIPPGLNISNATSLWIIVGYPPCTNGSFESHGRCIKALPIPARISGTPTTAGTYNIVMTVADSESPPMQASAPYSITISP